MVHQRDRIIALNFAYGPADVTANILFVLKMTRKWTLVTIANFCQSNETMLNQSVLEGQLDCKRKFSTTHSVFHHSNGLQLE